MASIEDQIKNQRLAPSLKDGQSMLVPVELLDDNPHQPRLTMDDRKLDELMADIRKSGLLQHIVVKPRSDGRYYVVAGHRRTEAFRRLSQSADLTESERAKYASIPAVVRMGVEPSEMAIMAFSENVSREALTPVEEGKALNKIAELLGLDSNKDIAKAVSQAEKRVERVRRIASAPVFIQAAVTTGVLVPVSKADNGDVTKERRQLDLMSGLEFKRLFEHYVRGKGEKPEKAELRTTTAIVRALASNYTLRKVEELVKAAIAGKQTLSDTADDISAEPSTQPIFETTAARFIVDRKKIATASPDQRAAARAAFEALFAPPEAETGKSHQ